jgi:hypothetical protein
MVLILVSGSQALIGSKSAFTTSGESHDLHLSVATGEVVMRAILLHVNAEGRTVIFLRCRLLSLATWLACENGRKLLYLPPWRSIITSPVLWSESALQKEGQADADLCVPTTSRRTTA